MLLNNQWVKEKIKRDFLKLGKNENVNTTYQNLCDA